MYKYSDTHREYTQFVRARKPGQKKIRKCIKKQLGYLGRNLKTISCMLEAGGELPSRWQERLETLQIVYRQQQQKKDDQPDKQQDYADICERVEVERRISLAKRKCGLGLLTAKLLQTTASAIALSIVVLNLRKGGVPRTV